MKRNTEFKTVDISPQVQDLMKLKGVPPLGNSPINTQHWLELIFKFIHAGVLRLLCAVEKIRYDDRITNTGAQKQ